MGKSKQHVKSYEEKRIKKIHKYPEQPDYNDHITYTLGKSVDFQDDDFSDLSNYYNNR